MDDKGALDLELLRPVEVAGLLRVSRPQVYRLLAAGLLPAVRLGPRCLRIPRRALEERLRELAAGPTQGGEGR
jgi:excisionase family DNA binding protein